MQTGSLKLKAQIVCGQEFAIGPGKADLLDAIAREGSIAAAARAMGMSYRRAWLLVDSMNRCWEDRLVEAASGGGAKRGARLTEAGLRVLGRYRALQAALARAAAEPLAMLAEGLRREPRPAGDPAGDGDAAS